MDSFDILSLYPLNSIFMSKLTQAGYLGWSYLKSCHIVLLLPIATEPINPFTSHVSSDDENEDEVSSKVPHMTKNTDEFVKAPHHQRSFGDSRESLAWFLDSLSQTIEKAVEKLKPIGPTQSEIVEAVDELNLERKVRHKALKLLRDKEAASQFLAQRNVDFRRNWLYDEMDATV